MDDDRTLAEGGSSRPVFFAFFLLPKRINQENSDGGT